MLPSCVLFAISLSLSFSISLSLSSPLSLSLSPSGVPPALGVSTVVMMTVVNVVVEAVTAAPSITETEAGRGEDNLNERIVFPQIVFQCLV